MSGGIPLGYRFEWVFDPATGSGAIATATAPGVRFRLLRVELHLSAAGTTAENFTVTRDAGDGPAYDTVLHKEDLSVGAITDLVIIFGKGYEFEADDEIDCAWANTEARVYGITVVYERIMG